MRSEATASSQADAAFQEGHRRTVFEHQGAFLGHPALQGQAAVLDQVAVFAVHRDEVPGAHGLQHDAQFLAVGVPRGVDGLDLLVEDFRAQAVEAVDDLGDGQDVARDEAGGEQHQIALLDGQGAVFVHGHARERRQGFAL
jgi:hypothetical protein